MVATVLTVRINARAFCSKTSRPSCSRADCCAFKRRRDRRPELPIGSAWAFYPKLVIENAVKFTRMAKHWKTISRSRRRVRYDPDRELYSDPALAPVTDDGLGSLEMFTHNDGAREAVSHARKVARITQIDRLAPAK